MTFILVGILAVMAYMQMNTALSLFLVKFQHLPETFFGWLVTLNALMVVFIQFPISRWASKRPPLLMMIGGAALYLVGFGSYGVTTTPALFVLGMALLTFGEMLFIPTSQALTALLAPEDMRARYVATERITWIVAQGLGPLASGLVMDHFDPRWVWYGCAILCSISMAGFWARHLRAGRRIDRQMVEASAGAAARARAAQVAAAD